ncbi:hypothetical protein M9458_021676 [Cirrhinus mrigala]|uniref:CBM21 domain-containing protein n=1 Tax=Cirrhinus mrigala TaxID=683832 RepID=A0ABD0Q8W9_CIRMR
MCFHRTVGISIYTFPERVMPMDLAMHAHFSPPVSQLLGMSALRTSPPNVSSPELQLSRLSPPSPTYSLSSSSSTSSLSSGSPGTPRKKKRVVFADAKGLSLTSVRLFTTDPSETETEDALQPEEHVKPRTPMQSMTLRLKLGFPLPVPDRASLKENYVQLESCGLTEKAFSGTVRVCNIKYDKTVFIRITFDSWRSHKDIPCTYVREQNGSLETELFSFNVPLPSDLDPKEHVEFFIVFRPGNTMQCVDNNRGKNYCILVENVAPEPRPVTTNRRTFAIPSPQRYSAWPGARGHELHRTRHLACKGPLYTERLLNRTWGRMANVPPLC